MTNIWFCTPLYFIHEKLITIKNKYKLEYNLAYFINDYYYKITHPYDHLSTIQPV